MKILMLIFSLGFIVNANADVVIDDFSTGELENTTFSDIGATDLYQSGDMVGGDRMLRAHINAKRDSQNLQVAILNDKLISSFGYNTIGVLKVNYGSSENGLNPMALDLVNTCESDCKTLNIEFDAKSSVSGLYVSLFTNSDRAVWRDHVAARGGVKRVTIPFSELNKIGANFTLEQVDYMRFQFDSRTKTGHNFAINKIWVQ